MNITTEAITNLVSACRRSIELAETLRAAIGIYETTEVDDIAAEIEEALCLMRGEDPNTDLDKTLTDQLIRDLSISCKSVAEKLIA